MNNNYNGTTIKFVPVDKDGKPTKNSSTGEKAVEHIRRCGILF